MNPLADVAPTQRTRTIVETGIVLPLPAGFRSERPDAPETVFVTVTTLARLAEQDEWDSQFGAVLTLGYFEGIALADAGLAVRETRGGYHRTDLLVAKMTEWGLA